MTKIIDCKGQLCPQPLIETKKAIKASLPGEIIAVVIDNATSCQNVINFLEDNNITFNLQQDGPLFNLNITIPYTFNENSKQAEEYCSTFQPMKSSKQYIVVLTSDTMGLGNNDLGKMLLKGFLNTLPSLPLLPQEIICYNSAVNLARNGSDTAQTLLKLNEQGVKITLCGTCVDFFGIKDELVVGTISNMLYITERLTSDIIVVKP